MRVVAHYLSTVMHLHGAAGKLRHQAKLIDTEIERSIAAGRSLENIRRSLPAGY